MITVTLFRNAQQQFWGFQMEGHAGYGEAGNDIICAAVSALAINAINSIEALTTTKPVYREKDGYLYLEVPEIRTSAANAADAVLLMNSFALGLDSIVQDYGSRYLKVLKTEK